jgi:hypothetical protein
MFNAAAKLFLFFLCETTTGIAISTSGRNVIPGVTAHHRVTAKNRAATHKYLATAEESVKFKNSK